MKTFKEFKAEILEGVFDRLGAKAEPSKEELAKEKKRERAEKILKKTGNSRLSMDLDTDDDNPMHRYGRRM